MKSLQILKYLLETPHAVTIKTLAENFDITERTVIRHLDRFRKAGFYVNNYGEAANVVGRFTVEI